MPSLWDKLNDFQALVAKVQAQSPNPKDKQLLGEMLQHINASQTLAKEKLEALLDHIKNQADDFKLKFEVAQQELEQAKEKAEALRDQAARREALEKERLVPTIKSASPPAAIDPHLGQQLRDELLAKLPMKRPAHADALPADPGSVNEEIFSDQNGGGRTKAEPMDQWPDELRTPSTRKSAAKVSGEGVKKVPPKPTPVDDESIGKSWSE